MGWLVSIFKAVIKISVVIFGTLLLQTFSVFLLSFILIPSPIQILVQLVATSCFFLALIFLVFRHSVRRMKWPLTFGFGLIVITLLIGGITGAFVLTTINPNLQLIVLGNLIFATALLFFMNPKWLRIISPLHQRILIAALEVHQDPAFTQQTKLPFKYVLSNLAMMNIPLGLRFYFLPSGHTRLFLYTWDTQQDQLKRKHIRLHQLLTIHFPKITFSPCELPQPPLSKNTPFTMIHLTGTPSETSSGFTALLKKLPTQATCNLHSQSSLKALPAVLFQVAINPTRLDRFERWFIQRKVDKQVQEAQQLLNTATLLAQGLPASYEMIPKLEDPNAIERARQVLRQFRVLQDQQLFQTQISIIGWHPTNQQQSQSIVQSLAITIANAVQVPTLQSQMKIHTCRMLATRKLRKLLDGSLSAPSTILHSSEAASFLGIPQTEKLLLPKSD